MIFTIVNNQTYIGTIHKINEYSLESDYLDVNLSYITKNDTFLPFTSEGKMNFKKTFTLNQSQQMFIKMISLELYYLSHENPNAKQLEYKIPIISNESL